METMGERIKRLRKESNLTQTQLAEKLGLKKGSIQKYENGSVVNLKTDIVEELSKLFNVSPSYILGWDAFDETHDVEAISSEVEFLEEIHRRFGYVGVDLCELCSQLNEEGKRKIIFYAQDLTGNPKYTV